MASWEGRTAMRLARVAAKEWNFSGVGEASCSGVADLVQAIVALRVDWRSARSWSLVRKLAGVSEDAASFLYLAAMSAGMGGILMPASVSMLVSALMRWPSCQLGWLALGTGRERRSASERSARVHWRSCRLCWSWAMRRSLRVIGTPWRKK